MTSCMSNGKVMIIHLIIGFIKKILLYKRSYFPERYTCRFIYLCQKFELQKATGVDTPYFERQADFTCLRTTVDKLDKLDVDKLEAVTVDLKELSDTVEKEVLSQRKNLMPFRLLILEIQFKKLTMTQKLLKLERKYLLIMITNISVYKNLTNSRQKIFLKN